jgi:transcriptional regulator with XRE-family HTH domain
MKTKEPSFGGRLRELREAAGLTQQALADLAGMHRQGVNKLEMGEREPTWASVKALCRALGVRCTAFEDEAPPPAKKGGKGRGKG